MSAATLDMGVIEFAHPLPGFPEQTRFTLMRVDDGGVLCQLCSLDDPALRFLVAPPTVFFPDYDPVVSEDALAELGITSADDVAVLVVIKAGAALDTTTANLMAPVLVDTVTRRASQVIVGDPNQPSAAPLVA